jgi:Ca2+-binding RTX toxin-like protein
MRLLGATAVALLAGLALASSPANAAYSATIQNGTLSLTGNRASDKLALRLQPGVPTTLQADVGEDGTANLSFDRSQFERILVRAGDGNDEVRIDESVGAFTDVQPTTLNGQAGDDTLIGGRGEEHLVGGPDDDVVDGGLGEDSVQLGPGADLFTWSPGRASDTIEGGDGADTLAFNCSNIGEQIDLSANANRLRLFRNVASVTMDLHGLERIDLTMLGGADTVAIHNLAATDANRVKVDLAGMPGGPGGDMQPDSVAVDGTSRRDDVKVSAKTGVVDVEGLPVAVRIANSEAANDSLAINGLGGVDTVRAGAAVADLISLIVNQ